MINFEVRKLIPYLLSLFSYLRECFLLLANEPLHLLILLSEFFLVLFPLLLELIDEILKVGLFFGRIGTRQGLLICQLERGKSLSNCPKLVGFFSDTSCS